MATFFNINNGKQTYETNRSENIDTIISNISKQSPTLGQQRIAFKDFDVVVDCTLGNVYNCSLDELERQVRLENDKYKNKLFETAVNAMDNYNKAIEMGLEDFANYYYCRMHELIQEIKTKGLQQEFNDFALVF